MDRDSLANTMGTAMQTLFQSKLATMQSQKTNLMPESPKVPPPSQGVANPATVASTMETTKEQKIADNLPNENILTASQLLFPPKTVGNNSSAASILGAKI